MRDESPQPSQIIFPIQLQPAHEVEQPAAPPAEPWGWLELFVLAQVFWGVLLFVPGSQAFRTYIRAFPYVTSLAALIGCARSSGTEMLVPGARWIIAVVVLLVFNLVHPETWFSAGVAQVVFQVSIAAPVFWAGKSWITDRRMERLLWLIFAANFVSATVGLLQVYYPSTFLPPQFSAMALKMNPEFISQLTYAGAGDRQIVRPPGLSDIPGGAAIAGTTAALLGFGFAMRLQQRPARRLLYLGAVVIGMTVIYLTQVRSMLLMILVCMLVLALIRLRRGNVVQSGWISASAGILVLGSFIWAVTVGGDVIQERYQDIYDTGVVSSYQENRGFFLDYTINRLPFEYPFGAGLGRWGMMTAYFNEPGNWQNPALYAEIQPTGWVYDGGVLMWLFYGGAISVAMRHSYRVSVGGSEAINDMATMVFMIQLLICGLCFTGPVFNTQVGIIFWLSAALLYGCERTATITAWNAEVEQEQSPVDAEA